MLMNGNSINSIEMLLVEDSDSDIRLTLEALKDSKIRNHISVVKDGVEAMAFLRHGGSYASVPRPNLILLDLNMPRKNGREVLKEIKNDPLLKRIPVVILTSSKAEEEVLRTYDLQANCYVSKPVDLEQFFKVVKAIEMFWFTIVELPKK